MFWTIKNLQSLSVFFQQRLRRMLLILVEYFPPFRHQLMLALISTFFELQKLLSTPVNLFRFYFYLISFYFYTFLVSYFAYIIVGIFIVCIRAMVMNNEKTSRGVEFVPFLPMKRCRVIEKIYCRKKQWKLSNLN